MITRPLLAATIPSLEELERLHLSRHPLYATPKIDGIRALMLEEGRFVTRKFKCVPSDEIYYYFTTILGPLQVDGELSIPGATFQETTSAVMSQFSTEAERVQYLIFDYHAHPEAPYIERVNELQKLFTLVPFRCRLLLPEEIKTVTELKLYEERCLELGYEGVMLRTGYGHYKSGRSTMREGILMKLKRFEDSEAYILDVTPLYTNQNPLEEDNFGLAKRSQSKEGMVPLEMLGAFTVRDVKKGVTFNVATGLTNEERIDLWKKRADLVGRVIKYKYQAIGVLDLPRFPVYLGFRED